VQTRRPRCDELERDFKQRISGDAVGRGRTDARGSNQELRRMVMKGRIVASVVVVALVVASVGYYEYSSYEGTVLSTTVVTGKITNMQGTPIPTPSPGTTTQSGATLVTISVGSDSFTQIVPCSPVRGYTFGQTLKVADQILRSGEHQYVPDIACRGSQSPFASLHLSTTTSSST
jgi:hypothetical protein